MLCGLYFCLTDKNRQRKRTQSFPSERKSATTFVAAHDLIDHRAAIVRHHAYNRFAFHSPIVVRHHVVSTTAYPNLQNAGRVIAAVDTRAKDPNAVARCRRIHRHKPCATREAYRGCNWSRLSFHRAFRRTAPLRCKTSAEPPHRLLPKPTFSRPPAHDPSTQGPLPSPSRHFRTTRTNRPTKSRRDKGGTVN